MYLRILLLAGAAMFACGCTSSPKKLSPGAPAPTSVVPIKTEVPSKVEVPRDELICKRTDEKRLLEVESILPKGCKLWYSRYGSRSAIASSALENAYCEKVRENIRTKLVNAGFECKSAQSGKNSSTPPASTTATIDAQKKAEPPKK